MSNSENKIDDRELEAYLAGDSEFSTLYAQQSQEQTPPDLDNFVVNAARKPAAAEKSKAAKKSKSPRRPARWMQPVAAVATLVLGLALTLDLLQDQAIMPADKQPDFAETGQAAAEEFSLEVQEKTVNSAAQPRPDSERRQAGALQKPEAETEAGSRRAAPAPALRTADRPEKLEPIAPQTSGDQAQLLSDEPVQAPVAQPVENTRPSPPAPAPRQREPQAAAQAKAPPFDRAPGPDKPESSSIPQDSGVQHKRDDNQQNNTPAQTFSPEPVLEPELGSGPRQAPEYRENPQTWLRHIVFLSDTGQREQAANEIREFRKRHPDITLPRELQALEQ